MGTPDSSLDQAPPLAPRPAGVNADAGLRDELLAARAEIHRLVGELALRDATLDMVRSGYEARLLGMRRTLVWRLGEILVHGFRSLGTLLQVPRELLVLRREFQRRKAAGQGRLAVLSGGAFNRLLECYQRGGTESVREHLATEGLPPTERAAAYAALAHALMTGATNDAITMARAAYEAEPTPERAAWLAFRLYDAGAVEEPSRILNHLPSGTLTNRNAQTRAAIIAGQARIANTMPCAPRRGAPAYVARREALLYVAASSLPHHTSGYTVRTHALLKAVRGTGLDVKSLTRPGYPWDRGDFTGQASTDSIVEAVRYEHLRQPSQHQPADSYVLQAAREIAAVATQHRAAVIHAASNHVNALPAMIAARRLGIPFHYEMRGLWDLSRASKQPGYEYTERFRLGQALEFHVARNADRLYVISQALADYLAEQTDLGDVPIELLPNGIDSTAYESLQAVPETGLIIRYAGAIVQYEGLELLIEAVARLRSRGVEVEAEIMGDGEARPLLLERVEQLGLGDCVRLPGRVSPATAREKLLRASLICLPRRPSKVCEIVPPLKLVEGMALGVPVLVPDLPVFRAEAEADVTALFFRPGDVDDLVRAIERCTADPVLRSRIARSARERVLQNRCWNAYASRIARNVCGDDERTPRFTA